MLYSGKLLELREVTQMDNKALFNLPYGVFMLATSADDVENGCITNTCIQVANDPTRIAIAVINANYTCELIKKSGIFTITLLDETCTFETIEHFGMQSGRDVDKMGNMTLPRDENGIPYLGWQSASVISAKVAESIDLGSHTLFIAEVTDAKVLSDNAPLTYEYYRNNIKPQPVEQPKGKKITGWRCRICGYVYEGAVLPDDFICPLCGHSKEDFEPIFE